VIAPYQPVEPQRTAFLPLSQVPDRPMADGPAANPASIMATSEPDQRVRKGEVNKWMV